MNKTELSLLTGDTIDEIVHSFEQITHLQGDTSNSLEDALFFYHGNHPIGASLTQCNLYLFKNRNGAHGNVPP